LPAPDAGALEAAAVLGRVVDVAEWRDVCVRLGGPPSAGLLDALLADGLATADPSGPLERWAFAHDSLRELVEGRAGDRKRLADVHRAAAEMLATRRAPDTAARRGMHLVAAGDIEIGAEELLAGAHARYRTGDYRGVEAALSARARALSRLGARDDDERFGDQALLSSLVAAEQGHTAEALAHARRAERIARAHASDVLTASALRVIATLEMERGAPHAAMPLVDEALGLAARAGDDTLLAACHFTHGKTLTAAGELRGAASAYRAAAERCDVEADALLAFDIRLNLGWLMLQLGDIDSALMHASRAFELAAGIGSERELCGSTAVLGEIARSRGDLDLAERQYRDALRYARKIGYAKAAFCEANLGLVQLERRRYPDARAHLEHAASQLGESRLQAGLHAGLAVCAAAAGDWDDWERALSVVRQICEQSSFADTDIAKSLEHAGDVARDAGHAARAEQAYRLAALAWRALDRREEAAAVTAKLATA
jgi:tetratricopeptide (TPR) repeat protein